MSLTAPLFDVRENLGFFETNLTTDRELSFSLLNDENPPRIVSHEITALNEITIVFNEALGVDYAGDALNYSIIDTNYENAEVTDELYISNITVDGAAVIIRTGGMTSQPDERYEVVLRGIRDIAGNAIDPNPRSVTIIQDEEFDATDATDNAIDTTDTTDTTDIEPLDEAPVIEETDNTDTTDTPPTDG